MIWINYFSLVSVSRSALFFSILWSKLTNDVDSMPWLGFFSPIINYYHCLFVHLPPKRIITLIGPYLKIIRSKYSLWSIQKIWRIYFQIKSMIHHKRKKKKKTNKDETNYYVSHLTISSSKWQNSTQSTGSNSKFLVFVFCFFFFVPRSVVHSPDFDRTRWICASQNMQ